MKKETLKKVISALAESEWVNTTWDFSLSIQETEFEGFYDGRIVIYPMERFPFFGGNVIRRLVAIGNVFDAYIRFDVNNGAAVCVIS